MYFDHIHLITPVIFLWLLCTPFSNKTPFYDHVFKKNTAFMIIEGGLA